MNDETIVLSTPYRCPKCGGQIRLEVTRPKGGGEATSEAYECGGCRKSFTLPALLLSAKVEALKVWLSDRMGAEVDTHFESKATTYWFRILVGVRPQPVLCVSLRAFEDHSVEKISNDLERQQVPGMLVSDPAQHLLYTTRGEVKRYHP